MKSDKNNNIYLQTYSLVIILTHKGKTFNQLITKDDKNKTPLFEV